MTAGRVSCSEASLDSDAVWRAGDDESRVDEKMESMKLMKIQSNVLQVSESDFSQESCGNHRSRGQGRGHTRPRIEGENVNEKARKEKDVEYKTKEAEGLDRTLTKLGPS